MFNIRKYRLKATPNLGYKVKKWTGTDNDASTETTNQVTLTGAKTVIGRVRGSSDFHFDDPGRRRPGDSPAGHRAAEFRGNGHADGGPGMRVSASAPGPGRTMTSSAFGKTTATVLVDKDKTVTVQFVSSTISHLDVRVIGGHGTVTPRRGDYPVGTPVNLEAYPDAGYRLKQWTGTDDDASQRTPTRSHWTSVEK